MGYRKGHSTMTFIQSKKAFRFYDKEHELHTPAQYVGELPDWAANTRLFSLAVKGGDITYVGAPPVAVAVEAPVTGDSRTDTNADAGGKNKTGGKA
jgi:hypothetical protein